VTAAGVAGLTFAALLIGAVLGLLVAGILSAGKCDDAYRRGCAKGAEALVIGERDRAILECPAHLTEAAADMVIEMWSREGSRAVLLTGGIRIAAVERHAELALAPEIREREA